jgi:hypothetical protein
MRGGTRWKHHRRTDDDFPAGPRHLPADAACERRFAGADRADDGDEGAARDGQRDVGEREGGPRRVVALLVATYRRLVDSFLRGIGRQRPLEGRAAEFEGMSGIGIDGIRLGRAASGEERFETDRCLTQVDCRRDADGKLGQGGDKPIEEA